MGSRDNKSPLGLFVFPKRLSHAATRREAALWKGEEYVKVVELTST